MLEYWTLVVCCTENSSHYTQGFDLQLIWSQRKISDIAIRNFNREISMYAGQNILITQKK